MEIPIFFRVKSAFSYGFPWARLAASLPQSASGPHGELDQRGTQVWHWA